LAFYARTELIAGLAGARNGSMQHRAPEFMVNSAIVYKCTLASWIEQQTSDEIFAVID
jgi:hypothetical protein